MIKSERIFSYADDLTEPGFIDNIVNNISWNILNKKGRVVFSTPEPIADFREIAPTIRY